MLEYATFEEASAALGAMHGRDMRLVSFTLLCTAEYYD